MKPTNWGIIGPGNIAYDFAHDLTLIESPQRITAVLGHTAESAEKFAEEFDVSHSFCYHCQTGTPILRSAAL